MGKQDPRNLDTLYNAFANADILLTKKYVNSLQALNVCESMEAITKINIGSNVKFLKITQIVYDSRESIHDKLTTVYSSLCSNENLALVLVLKSDEAKVELYIGVADRRLNPKQLNSVLPAVLDMDAAALKGIMEGHFPGTKMEDVNSKEFVKNCFSKIKVVASVSSIAALRNQQQTKNDEFVQGMEKLIDSMRGKKYTAIYLADVMPAGKIESLCSEYEDIYSQLSPFKQSVQSLSENESFTNTESTSESVANTVSDSLGKTLSHGVTQNTTKTHSLNVGVHGGCPFFGASVGYGYSKARSEGTQDTDSKTDTHTIAKSLTSQNSVSKAISNGTSESMQITYDNRAVKTLLDRIDEQIKRLRNCEDFGLFDSCVYFLSENYADAVSAASTYKSLIRGENSSVESSAVNVWNANDAKDGSANNVELIIKYLERFYHPLFSLFKDDNYSIQVTPALLISGSEVAYQFALPKKSTAGLPIITCAEFGRNVLSTSGVYKGDMQIGKLYHMMQIVKPEQPIHLLKDALTSHVFVTGSTGAGKSNTVFKLLEQADTNFLVIEPAKSEYKDVFGGHDGVKVFGTNPKITALLRINPFSFPSQIAVSEHIDRLIEIFNVCWPMYAAMPAILKDAVVRAYEIAGWDIATSENKYASDLFPTFQDVLTQIKIVLAESDYSSDNKGDYTGALVTRLKSLTNGIYGQIFAANGLYDAELFDGKVIVDLSRVGSIETKALIMGLLILKLQEYRLSNSKPDNSKLRHITVLEEAHNLLKRTSTDQSSDSSNLLGKSVEMLTNAIAEMRAFGEGFIIADQAPGLLDMAVIRNTNTKIIHRLPDQSDRELVGRSAGLDDEQIAELSKLELGVAAIYQNNWIEAVLCRIDPFDNKTKYEICEHSNNIDGAKMDITRLLITPNEHIKFDRNLILQSSYSASTKIKVLKAARDGITALSPIEQSEIVAELHGNLLRGVQPERIDQARQILIEHFAEYRLTQKEIDKLIVLFSLVETDMKSIEDMNETQLRFNLLYKDNGGV